MPFSFFNCKKTSVPTKGSIQLDAAKSAERILKTKLAPRSVIKDILHPEELLFITLAPLGALFMLGWLASGLRCFVQNNIMESNTSENFLLENLGLELQSIFLIIYFYKLLAGYDALRINYTQYPQLIQLSDDEFDTINKGLTGFGEIPLSKRSNLRNDTENYLRELSESISSREYKDSVSTALSVLPDVLVNCILEFNEEDNKNRPK